MSVTQFFDSRASRWDQIAHHDEKKLRTLIDTAAIKPGDAILDVGCGTGVLIPYLLEATGPQGSVTALDLSPRMLAEAQRKFSDPRLSFLEGDYLTRPLNFSVGVITAYSCFPHFPDPDAFFRRSREILSSSGGGTLLIGHSQGRHKINSLHDSLEDNCLSRPLPPVTELADTARSAGFEVEARRDTEEIYLLRAVLVPKT